MSSGRVGSKGKGKGKDKGKKPKLPDFPPWIDHGVLNVREVPGSCEGLTPSGLPVIEIGKIPRPEPQLLVEDQALIVARSSKLIDSAEVGSESILEVLCDRRSLLGNPFDMLDKEFGESLRDSVCEAFDMYIEKVLKCDRADERPIGIVDIVNACGLNEKNVSKEWRSRHRGPGPVLCALDEIASLAQKRGAVRLMCHCVPKRCHALRIRQAISERLGTDVKSQARKNDVNGKDYDSDSSLRWTQTGKVERGASSKEDDANKVTLSSVEKARIRASVWDVMTTSGFAAPPLPVTGRIPNHVGAAAAAAQLIALREFEEAKCIKVDPDSSLKDVRIGALKAGKTILVPVPQLRTGFLRRLHPAKIDANKFEFAATQQGMAELGEDLGFEAKVRVDLLVVGAVAVDATHGARLGKGRGFSDFEYAALKTMKAICNGTPVVACVHDCQVVKIPCTILSKHDAPVDIICTPTRTYRTTDYSLPKPEGIFWNELSPELARTPAVAALRQSTALGEFSGDPDPPERTEKWSEGAPIPRSTVRRWQRKQS